MSKEWHCIDAQQVDIELNELTCWAILKPFLSTSDDTVYLTFRGTHTYEDYLADITIVPHRIDESNLFVYGGAYTSIVNDWPRLRAALESLSAGTRRVMVTGHSLGGALAHLFVFHAKLKMQREKEQLMNLTFEAVTFAAPMVLCVIGTLDGYFQALVNDYSALCTNFVVNNDYVPLLPRVCNNVDYLTQFKELVPGFAMRTAVRYAVKKDWVNALAKTFGFVVNYRTAAMTTIIMVWAEDKKYPQATNKPCPYVLTPEQFEELTKQRLYEQWTMKSDKIWKEEKDSAPDHRVEGYIRFLAKISEEYGAK